jgi:hypothetical protein
MSSTASNETPPMGLGCDSLGLPHNSLYLYGHLLDQDMFRALGLSIEAAGPAAENAADR